MEYYSLGKIWCEKISLEAGYNENHKHKNFLTINK